MSYSEEFINELKLKLLREKDEILALVESSKTYELDSDGDETDEIQAKLIHNVDSKLASKKLENLNKINAALAKIASGKFGACEECEEDIEKNRLFHNPNASKCISCANEEEINKNRYWR